MNPVRLFRLELRRLFRSRLTWLVMLLTLLSPAVGLYLYRPLYSTSATGYVTTTLGAYVANPALTGGLLGAIFFALLTIWELDRVKRGGVGGVPSDGGDPPRGCPAVWVRCDPSPHASGLASLHRPCRGHSL